MEDPTHRVSTKKVGFDFEGEGFSPEFPGDKAEWVTQQIHFSPMRDT